jgi:hypothetical protein
LSIVQSNGSLVITSPVLVFIAGLDNLPRIPSYKRHSLPLLEQSGYHGYLGQEMQPKKGTRKISCLNRMKELRDRPADIHRMDGPEPVHSADLNR